MNREEIRQQLFAMQDTDYREFQVKLIPTVDPEKVIGVRTPQLRKFAKELSRDPDAERFLEDLPHEYFDENQLHTFLISELKDFDSCILKTTGRPATSSRRRSLKSTTRSFSSISSGGSDRSTPTSSALPSAC